MKILLILIVLILSTGCQDKSTPTVSGSITRDSVRLAVDEVAVSTSTSTQDLIPPFYLPPVNQQAIQQVVASTRFFVGVFEAYLVANFGNIESDAKTRNSEDFPCEYSRMFDFRIQYTVDGCSIGVLTETMTFPKVSSREVRKLVTDIIATPNGGWTADSSFYEVEVGGGAGCDIGISHSSDSTTLTVFCTD